MIDQVAGEIVDGCEDQALIIVDEENRILYSNQFAYHWLPQIERWAGLNRLNAEGGSDIQGLVEDIPMARF